MTTPSKSYLAGARAERSAWMAYLLLLEQSAKTKVGKGKVRHNDSRDTGFVLRLALAWGKDREKLARKPKGILKRPVRHRVIKTALYAPRDSYCASPR